MSFWKRNLTRFRIYGRYPNVIFFSFTFFVYRIQILWKINFLSLLKRYTLPIEGIKKTWVKNQITVWKIFAHRDMFFFFSFLTFFFLSFFSNALSIYSRILSGDCFLSRNSLPFGVFCILTRLSIRVFIFAYYSYYIGLDTTV